MNYQLKKRKKNEKKYFNIFNNKNVIKMDEYSKE